jgi:hypothetical protein
MKISINNNRCTSCGKEDTLCLDMQSGEYCFEFDWWCRECINKKFDKKERRIQEAKEEEERFGAAREAKEKAKEAAHYAMYLAWLYRPAN